MNLIALNKVPGSRYNPASAERMSLFEKRLTEAGIETSVRNSRGSDIDAACGQLKQRIQRG